MAERKKISPALAVLPNEPKSLEALHNSLGGKSTLIKAQQLTHDEHALKAYTRWWQSILPPGTGLHDLCVDIRSSLPLIELLEALTSKRIPGVKRKVGSANLQQLVGWDALVNFDEALKFCKTSLGLRLINITASGLAEGERAPILALTCAPSRSSVVISGYPCCH